MSQIEIRSEGPSQATVTVDGQDVSHLVRSITTAIHAGEKTVVLIDAVVHTQLVKVSGGPVWQARVGSQVGNGPTLPAALHSLADAIAPDPGEP